MGCLREWYERLDWVVEDEFLGGRECVLRLVKRSASWLEVFVAF